MIINDGVIVDKVLEGNELRLHIRGFLKELLLRDSNSNGRIICGERLYHLISCLDTCVDELEDLAKSIERCNSTKADIDDYLAE